MGSISMNDCRNCGKPYCFGRCHALERGKKEESFGVMEYQKMQEEMAEKVEDKINWPKHYNQGKIQPADAILDWKLGFCLGNVVKYVARANYKGAKIEDLKKARWYLDREISILEGKI